MSQMVIFSASKPFTDPQIALIQRNAIQSWLKLPAVEVLMVGDDASIVETATEPGARNVAAVPCSQNGLPLISGMFNTARQVSDAPLLAYVNVDIILLPDFAQAAYQVSEQVEDFLLAGRLTSVSVCRIRAEWRQLSRSFSSTWSIIWQIRKLI